MSEDIKTNEEKVVLLDLAGIEGESIVDGPGFRFAVFCQGCPHECPGCHNPTTHPFGTGTKVAISRLLEAIDKDPILRGVTFSGGEPFCQAGAFLELGKGGKERGLDIVVFTGYRLEELLELAGYDLSGNKVNEEANGTEWASPEEIKGLLDICDILIDGRFVLAERDLTLQFRGSRNQRVIDMNKTREQGEVIIWE